jgi:hypothetical protein
MGQPTLSLSVSLPTFCPAGAMHSFMSPLFYRHFAPLGQDILFLFLFLFLCRHSAAMGQPTLSLSVSVSVFVPTFCPDGQHTLSLSLSVSPTVIQHSP